MNEALFRWMNGTACGPVFDAVMPIASDKTLILIPLLAAFVALQYFGDRRLRVTLWALVIAFALSDFGSGQILKALSQIQRPYTVLDGVHLHRGDGWELTDAATFEDSSPRYGFPSSHASNAAALVLVLALFYRRSLWLTVPWALLVGYSRVYTGNHWPFDVVAGFGYGALSGWAAWALVTGYARRHWGSFESPPRVARPPEDTFFAGALIAWFCVQMAVLRLSPLPLSGEEAYLWDLSRRLSTGYVGAPPLTPLLVELFTAMGGNETWALRSTAVFASGVTAIVAYAFAVHTTHSRRMALGSGLLVLAFFFLDADTFRLSTATVAVAFIAAGVYFHVRGNGRLAGLTLGCAVLADTNALFVAVFLVVFAYVFSTQTPSSASLWMSVPLATALAAIPAIWALCPPLAAQPWSPLDTAVPELVAWTALATAIPLWWVRRPHRRWALPALVVVLALPIPLALVVHLGPNGDVYHPVLNPFPGLATVGEAVDALRDSNEGDTFVCANTDVLSAALAFYTPGRPRTLCLDTKDRPYAQYDLWNEWEDWIDGDGVLVVAGKPEEGRRRLDAALATGAFASGTVIGTIDTGRPYTLCWLTGYNGRPMNRR